MTDPHQYDHSWYDCPECSWREAERGDLPKFGMSGLVSLLDNIEHWRKTWAGDTEWRIALLARLKVQVKEELLRKAQAS